MYDVSNGQGATRFCYQYGWYPLRHPLSATLGLNSYVSFIPEYGLGEVRTSLGLLNVSGMQCTSQAPNFDILSF